MLRVGLVCDVEAFGSIAMSPPAAIFAAMDVVYTLDGRPFRVDDDRLWSRDGQYVGRVVDGMVFNINGTYLGEFRSGDRLGFKHSHAAKRKAPHSPRANRSGISRMDRLARIHPIGWEEFHG